jgi:glycosyltransferase involved in cell wall biosynthesis
MLSFIVPAYNEAAFLPASLDALYAAANQLGQPFEVIVVNDGSTDATAEIARQRGARVLDVAFRHIAATRNAGGQAAVGNTLFFIDADTHANVDAITAALVAMDNGAVGGGCVIHFFGAVPWWSRMLLPLGRWLARRFTVCGGAFLFCRKSAFDAVGGFSERYFAAEDIAFVKALKTAGRFVIVGPTVATSSRKMGKISIPRFLVLLTRLVFRGPESFRNRDELGLWYGKEARDEPPQPTT